MNQVCPECKRPFKKDRSSQQNKSYWKLCVEPLTEFLKDRGYTSEDVHELLKMTCNYEVKFLPNRDGTVSESKIPRSTTKLTTVEFNEFMARVRQFASELGCYLCEPNEQPIE